MHENCGNGKEEHAIEEEQIIVREQNEQQKCESLQWVLKKLVAKEISEDTRQEMKQRLLQVYTDGFRHQYSFITGYLLQLVKESENNGNPIDLATVAESAELQLLDLISDCPENVNFCKGVKKFADHISLEVVRLDYIKGMYRPAITELDHIGRKIDGLNESLRKQERDTEKVNVSLENQKMDFIAILGIFSGIVLAFVGGITFSNSALQGIAGITIYRLIAVAVVCGMVLINTIAVAMSYISKIVFRSVPRCGSTDRLIIVIDMMFIGILALTSICYCIEFKWFDPLLVNLANFFQEVTT